MWYNIFTAMEFAHPNVPRLGTDNSYFKAKLSFGPAMSAGVVRGFGKVATGRLRTLMS